jgi:hypothetical protein
MVRIVRELIDISQVRDFWSNVDLLGDWGCWIWRGEVGEGVFREGYGVYAGEAAHRVALSLFLEDFDRSLVVHHFCGIRLCVNPAHLEQIFNEDHLRLHRELKKIGWNEWRVEDRLIFSKVEVPSIWDK